MNYDKRKEVKFKEEEENVLVEGIKQFLQLLLLIPILVGFVLFAVFIVIPANIWDWIWN